MQPNPTTYSPPKQQMLKEKEEEGFPPTEFGSLEQGSEYKICFGDYAYTKNDFECLKYHIFTHTLITRSFTDILFPPKASCNELSWERNLHKKIIKNRVQ